MPRGHIEEEYDRYFRGGRKEEKTQKKLASSKDRSKFKKTDCKKYLAGIEQDQEAKAAKSELFEGRILSISSKGAIVDCQGEIFLCTLKGLLKRERTLAKNLAIVGDFVLFEKNSKTEGVIAKIKPRRSVLSRADNLSRRKEQLIASNIDQVLVTVSVVDPPLKPALIDRYIIAAMKGRMSPIIVVNKIDLLAAGGAHPLLEQEKKTYEELLKAYARAGVPVIAASAADGSGMEELEKAMQGKASVFSGQSGVGKSSLINAAAGLDLKTGSTVEKTGKGSHTTSAAQLVPLKNGGWCIDTPGIKSFGLWDLKRNEIEGYFTEINELGRNCKFIDCTHTHEDNCAVLNALEENLISRMRYDSYQSLLRSIEEKHLRR